MIQFITVPTSLEQESQFTSAVWCGVGYTGTVCEGVLLLAVGDVVGHVGDGRHCTP